jgi:hypothetical protein
VPSGRRRVPRARAASGRQSASLRYYCLMSVFNRGRCQSGEPDSECMPQLLTSFPRVRSSWRSLDQVPVLPDSADVPDRVNLPCRVTIHEQQVRSIAHRNPASIFRAPRLRRHGGCSLQSLGWSHPRPNQVRYLYRLAAPCAVPGLGASVPARITIPAACSRPTVAIARIPSAGGHRAP